MIAAKAQSLGIIGDPVPTEAGSLGPGGALSQVLSGYEDRPSQRRMAAAVNDALLEARPLLVEAGTGTGKTLAYLTPAAASGMRVVISTGTRALQEQLAEKDVGLLRDISGSAVRVSVLKGVSNYVCQRKLAIAAGQPTLGLGDSRDGNRRDGDRRDLDAILRWTGHTGTGDRAELGIIGEDAAVWKRVTTSADARLGSDCPFIDRCFVAKARKAAERSELIIVNHHLFFTDFALRRRGVGAKVLPDYDAVVFDEAHTLEDIIATHMGPSLSGRGVARLAADLRRPDAQWSQRRTLDWLERCGAKFFAAVSKACPQITSGSRQELPEQLFRQTEIREAWLELDSALDDIVTTADRLAALNEDHLTRSRLFSAALTAQRMRDSAAEIAEPDGEPCGQWVEREGHGANASVRLCSAPASAAEIIGELVADTPATIFTSATLTAAGQFNFVRSRLGLSAQVADELQLASPFDYASQALLYLPRDLPDPGSADFCTHAAARMLALIELCSGGAFCLFTSWRALRQTAELLRPALARANATSSASAAKKPQRTLLVQGDAPKNALLEMFRADGNAILLATGSFWQGVDVVGDSLSLVIIDRLPFSVPSDPLHRARMQRIERDGGDPFEQYQIPQAALHLKQGFGRLIRSRRDRGVVAVLDRRVVTKRYGREFLETLPKELPRTSALESVRRFFAAGASEPSEPVATSSTVATRE